MITFVEWLALGLPAAIAATTVVIGLRRIASLSFVVVLISAIVAAVLAVVMSFMVTFTVAWSTPNNLAIYMAEIVSGLIPAAVVLALVRSPKKVQHG